MTAALDAIRAYIDVLEHVIESKNFHLPVPPLGYDLAALDRAEAVVVAARAVKLDWADLNRPTDLVPLLAALDAYEDAAKETP